VGAPVQRQLRHRVFAHRHRHAPDRGDGRHTGDGAGDEALLRALERSAHPVASADLREALAEGTGKPAVVNGAFDAYFYGTGRTDDRIESLSSREVLPLPGYHDYRGKQVLVDGKAINKAIDKHRKSWKAKHPNAKKGEGAFPYRTVVVVRRDAVKPPQTLRIHFADGSHRDFAVTAQDSWQRFVVTTRAKATSAQLDPQGLLPMDANRLNDSRTLEAQPAAARRWFGDLTALLQSFFALLATI